MRTEFYNQWAASVHHSGGKQQRAEIFEIDEIPQASQSSQSDKAPKEKNFVYDKHLPAFDFEGYPNVSEGDEDFSPRTAGGDEVWLKYDK
jgi:hypothetical protein